jgi:CSLREA domain-containing protein
MVPMLLMLISCLPDACSVLCRGLLIGLRRLVAIALSFVFCLGFNVEAQAATFVVNSTGDSSDVTPGNGTCNTGGTNSQGAAECTLRAAVEEANAFAGGDTINFNMPVTEPGYSAAPLTYTTQAATTLPTISTLVVIDGSSQPDFPGTPIVVLDGISAGGGVHGLRLANGSDGSTIRGLRIIRFSANGLEIQSSADGLTIAGNWIGSDGSGASAPGNGNNGINLLAANTTIGGTAVLDRNVINNNGNEGINLTGVGATGNTIRGNYIGLENDGSSGSGNGDVGIAFLSGASGNTIGGLTADSRNVISMNFEGIEINSANNVVVGNYIGTDAGGTLDRGSRGDDGLEIQLGGNNNTIGGTAAGAANLIAFNQNHGINITAGTGNTILGNSIHSNDLRGIDLGNNGVTANDLDDLDSGPNDLLNFPVVTSVTHSGGTLTVDFQMVIPPGNYRVEFFKNPVGADPSGNGEGQIYADAITVADGGGGTQIFSHSFPGSVGDIITASTTEEFAGPGYGSTSEFGPAITAVALPVCPGGVVTTTADSGAGSLRDCIKFANNNPGTSISFNIPGPGNRSLGGDTWWGIALASPLPTVTSAATVIDGATQTTNLGNTNSLGPEIEIDGAGAGIAADGLIIGATAGGSMIRGLAIGNFADNGIVLLGGNNSIEGNFVGLSADGTTVAANNTNNVTNQGGVRVESVNNTIGGNTAADRNAISGNFFAGVELFGPGATGNQVGGNYIGLDATGTLDRGNTQAGIDLEFAGNNQIGGPVAGERNIISGNGSDGVAIGGGDFNQVWGNFIGTDVTGALVIPNDRDGVDINENGGDGALNNLIGGIGPNDGNLIRGNGIYGVQVRGALAVDNTIHGNLIYGNVALDIDLNDDGITVNDPLDADTGSNHLMNHPVIVSAQESGGTITAYFSLDVPAADYRIEFFRNPSGAHINGNGGGEVIAGATTITHGGTGVEYFVHSFSGSAGDVITATATEHLGGPLYVSTSEFSAAVTAIAGQLCPGGTITTTADSITGGSLRSCIIRANFNPGADVLPVPAGTYTLTIAGTNEDAATQGDLDITDNLTLNGAGAMSTIIDGNSLDRVFEVITGTGNISGITVRNGNTTSTGGGILNSSNLILSEVTISGNTAVHGGGIDNFPGASLTLSRSTVSGNTAISFGGGFRDRSTSVLTNVTVSGNAADEGGGISLRDGATLLNVTVTANSAVQGGGIQSQGLPSASTVKNTIIAGNPIGGDCDGALTILGNNLDSDGSCVFGLTDPAPMLGPLQDNGGPTFTHALFTGSLAIDAGDSSVCIAPGNDTDQRGFPRPVGASCDIGAYEGEIVQLTLIKTAFWTDGTPIPTGATIPNGVEFKYLLYVNNPGIARSDVSVRDVLDPAFQYQAGTIQIDNSLAECAAAVCTPAEEQAIFSAVDGAAVLTDAVDGDIASYTGASSGVDAGDGNVGNLQLDINANAVWAILFSVKMP